MQRSAPLRRASRCIPAPEAAPDDVAPSIGSLTTKSRLEGSTMANTNTIPKYPYVKVTLVGKDGNAFAILVA